MLMQIYDEEILPDWVKKLLLYYREKLRQSKMRDRKAMGLPEIDNTGEFWYSETQKNLKTDSIFGGKDTSTFAKINGKIIEFTSRGKPIEDDAIYLGKGQIYFAERKGENKLIILGDLSI